MSWDTKGQACICTQRNKYGPFCQQLVSGDMPAFDTVCRMKHVARTVFERNFAMANTRPEGIVLLHQDYVKQMYEMMEDYDWREEGITMVKVECTPDGNFEPMQCVRDVLTWTDIACYCVDHNGTELIGTRMDIKDGKPNCGGEDQQMCPVGYPLHGADGNMLKCGANVDRCPKGYECTRGAYGQQHCCLTRKDMSADVGTCPYGQPQGTCTSAKPCPDGHMCKTDGNEEGDGVKKVNVQLLEQGQRSPVTMSVLLMQCVQARKSAAPMDVLTCTADGYWASEQCHKAFGLCWCVTPMGHFVSDTMTHGPASCDSLTEFDIVRADQLKVDPATVELDGLSQCEAEQKQAATVVQERHITMQMMTDKNGDNDMDDDWYDDDMMDDEYSVGTNTYERLRVILPDIPLDCQLAPMTGPCRGYFPKWFYNPKMGTCDMFVWGMCQGNKNRFDSPAECYNTLPVSPNHATGIYIPRCMSDGDYSHKQCHDRYCWCVDEMGHYLDGLTTRGSELTCTANECFGGKKPNITCVKACTKPVCPGNPEAMCKVDLCSDDCAVKFVAEEGAEVDCQECFGGKKPNITCVKACTKPVCPGNPEAMCKVDLCSDDCAVKFVAEDGAEVDCQGNKCEVFTFDDEESKEECAVSLGVCEAQTCNVLNARAAARLKGLTSNDTSLILPECDQKGRFKPKQCQGQMCMCVDEFGKTVGEPSDDSCEGDSILEKLAESGINPANVKIGDLYEGSIKVDVEIIESLDDPTGKVALASNALRQAVESGDLDIVVDGQSFALDPEETIVTPQTASQVAQEVTTTTDGTTSSTPTPADDDDSGLTDTEKIIIGSVCGAVGLLILIIICYVRNVICNPN
ncbi:kunitz domain-containing protein [Plakobranchus ocellatus]|uniref:Kunitz domain-containing protein n=1 Tax=Plakobranchus ocellatus TaxID=259542 RepID=A0AAV4ATU6_9GAST|nr:kunitz domain-containing protein [Plakobranchus ocellatus]